jgi:hypothetical protein
MDTAGVCGGNEDGTGGMKVDEEESEALEDTW